MVDSHDEPDARDLEATPWQGVMLSGSLPCINCNYELQGLSVRGNCPECGVAIRATILYRVDPHADAFHPLPTRRLTAWSVAMWPTGAALAVVFSWALRLSDAMSSRTGTPLPIAISWFDWAVIVAIGMSGVSVLGLIRPTIETAPKWVFAAVIGLLGYIPLIWCWSSIIWTIDAHGPPPYFQAAPNAHRIILRLCIGLSALGILLCLRHNARQLVARSLVLRTGRVNRQTIYATAASIGVAMVGDLMRLIASSLSQMDRLLLDSAGSLLILIGSLLVTLALVGASIDGWRIRRALLTPSPSLGEVIELPTDPDADPAA
jgi:hypothetical protein